MKVSQVIEILSKYKPCLTVYDNLEFEKYIGQPLHHVDEWNDWDPDFDDNDTHACRVARWVQIYRNALLAEKICKDTLLRKSPAYELLLKTVIQLDWVDENIEIVDGNHRFCALAYILKEDGEDVDITVSENYLNGNVTKSNDFVILNV